MLDPPGGAAGPPRGTTGVPPLFALVGGWPVVGGGKVEPCAATVDEVGGGNVDPWVPSVVVVLATVVGGTVVGGGNVDPWVPSVVVVVLFEPHGPINETEVDRVRLKPSVQRTCTVRVMLPVTFPGTTVVAEVVSDGEPFFPTFAL